MTRRIILDHQGPEEKYVPPEPEPEPAPEPEKKGKVNLKKVYEDENKKKNAKEQASLTEKSTEAILADLIQKSGQKVKTKIDDVPVAGTGDLNTPAPLPWNGPIPQIVSGVKIKPSGASSWAHETDQFFQGVVEAPKKCKHEIICVHKPGEKKSYGQDLGFCLLVERAPGMGLHYILTYSSSVERWTMKVSTGSEIQVDGIDIFGNVEPCKFHFLAQQPKLPEVKK